MPSTRIHHGVEELAHAQRVGAVEERRVRRHPEAAAERFANASTATSYTPSRHTASSCSSRSRPCGPRTTVLGWREDASPSFSSRGERSCRVDVLPAATSSAPDARCRIHERLAPDRDHGRAAFSTAQALLDGEVTRRCARVLDLPHPRRRGCSGRAAQHQHQRIALPATQALAEHVGGDGPHLRQRTLMFLRNLPTIDGARRARVKRTHATASATCRAKPRRQHPLADPAVMTRLNASTP